MHRCNVSQNRQCNYLSSLFNQLIRQLCIPGVSSSVHYITSQDVFHQDPYSFTKACKSLRIEYFLECGITAFCNLLFIGKQQTNKEKKMQISIAQYQKKKNEVNDINLCTCSFKMKYPLFTGNLWGNAKRYNRNMILMAKIYKPSFAFLRSKFICPKYILHFANTGTVWGGVSVGFIVTMTWT